MKSYLRFLSRNKLYTAIEVVGLSLAMAFVIPLINYYTSLSEITKGHDNYENIYGMCFNETLVSSPGFGEALKRSVPEINKVTSPVLDNRLFEIDDFRKKVNYVDKDFFYFFPCSFSEGDAGFIDIKGAAAVSSEFAAELAQEGPVIGRTLTKGTDTYVVSAVFDEYGSGVLADCDMIVSNESQLRDQNNDYPFGVRGSLTIFSVNPSADITLVTEKIRNTAMEYWGASDEKYRMAERYKIIRYNKMTTGNEAFMGIKRNHFATQILIGALCMLLFIIALLNYINLNIALATKRAKEAALRKLNGAGRKNILLKYCVESVAFTSLCFISGLLLSGYTSDMLSMFVSNSGLGDMDFTLIWSLKNVLIYIGVIILTGIICGLAPALIVSRFSPLDVTKGEFRYHSKKYLNRIFIGFQSILSFVLLAVTLLLEVQYMNMNKVEYNCDIDDVFFFKPEDRKFKTEELYNELKGKPEILNVGLAEAIPGYVAQYIGETAEGSEIKYACLFCDEDAFDIFGFDILSQNDRNDRSGLWTTPFADLAFSENPGLLEFIMEDSDISSIRHAGQVQNFPSLSYLPIDDCITMVCVVPSNRLSTKSLVIRTTSDHKAARKVIAEAYTELSGKAPEDMRRFEPGAISCYVEENHIQQIDEFHSILDLFRIILGIVILMSMLGLTGMSVYYAADSEHETAIRKVFGGTVDTETFRNIRMYMRITLIAAVIATPVTYLIFNMLKSMPIADRVESTWWIYVVTIIISTFISLASVFWQTLRAARTNPAEALKKE